MKNSTGHEKNGYMQFEQFCVSKIKQKFAHKMIKNKVQITLLTALLFIILADYLEIWDTIQTYFRSIPIGWQCLKKE